MQILKCLEMTGNGWNQMEIAGNDLEWLDMAENGWKWLNWLKIVETD